MGEWAALVVVVGICIVGVSIGIRYMLDRQGLLEPAPANLNGTAPVGDPTGDPSQVPVGP